MCSPPHHRSHDSFNEATEHFLKWLQHQPGTNIIDKVKVDDLRTQGQGRGLVAVESIDKDEELFSVPTDLVLSVATSSLDSSIKSALEPLEGWAALVIALIFEDAKGATSYWAPYCAILPGELDTLMFWSEEELSELQGSMVLHKIGKQSADDYLLASLWPIVKANISHFGRHQEGFSSPDGSDYFLTMAHRMASIIFAYGFDLDPDETTGDDSGTDDDEYSTMGREPTKAMVPLADILNADADLNNARLIQSDSRLTMTAIKPIGQGEQIFNDFGELPRSGLLRLYGYVTDRYRKWDVVEIPESLIVSTVDFTEDGERLSEADKENRLNLAERLQCREDGFDLTWGLNGDSGLPSTLVHLVRTLQMSSQSLADEISSRQHPLQVALTTPSLSAYLAFKSILDLRLQQYGSTIAEDAYLLEHRERLPHRHRLAIEVRKGEKELIAHWLQKTVSSIQNMQLPKDSEISENVQQAKKKKVKG